LRTRAKIRYSSSVRGPAEFLGGLAVDTLQWSMGLFCAVMGALMLVVPHQLNGQGYAAIASHLTAWGLLGLAAGIGLLAVPVTRPRPVVTAVVHGAVGAPLLRPPSGLPPPPSPPPFLLPP